MLIRRAFDLLDLLDKVKSSLDRLAFNFVKAVLMIFGACLRLLLF